MHPLYSHPVYSIQQIRAIEQAAIGPLMARAGLAAAQAAMRLMNDGAAVLVLAGPGNNGGDALEVAANLAHAGYAVSVMIAGDPAAYGQDAQRALQRMQASQAQVITAPLTQNHWALVIDGLFGIGLQRPISGAWRELVETVNRFPCPILALDVPSSLDADTGNVVGPEGIAIRASHTITFIGDKPGLHTADGRDHAGLVQVAGLDIDPALYPPATVYLNEPALFTPYLRARRHNTHKGSYGDVAVVGGAHGMGGAAILAGRAAAHCGAGRVYVAFIGEAPPYDSGQPELMCRAAAELKFGAATLVLGPGMGESAAAAQMLDQLLAGDAPLVLDADALNLLAVRPDLQALLTRRHQPPLLTPHPLEAARLLGSTSAAVQHDRLAAARALAARFKAVVVLKGSGSIIAQPDGRCVINTTGNAGLATAGSGDVLSGLCGALLAQGWPVPQAAMAAVWLHGRAADVLVGRGIGPIGLTAGELTPVLRELLNHHAA